MTPLSEKPFVTEEETHQIREKIEESLFILVFKNPKQERPSIEGRSSAFPVFCEKAKTFAIKRTRR